MKMGLSNFIRQYLGDPSSLKRLVPKSLEYTPWAIKETDRRLAQNQARVSELESKVNSLNDTLEARNILIAFQRRSIVTLREDYAQEVANHYLGLHPREFIIAIDAKDHVIGVSNMAAKKLKKTPEELINLNIYTIIEDGNKIRAKLQLNPEKKPEPITLTNIEFKDAQYVLDLVVLPMMGKDHKNPDSRVYSGAIIRLESRNEKNLRKRQDRKAIKQRRLKTLEVNQQIEADLKNRALPET